MEPISLLLCVCGAVIVLPILAILSRFFGGSSKGTGSARPRTGGGGGFGGGSARPRNDDPDIVSSGGFGRRPPAPRQPQPQPRSGRPDAGSSGRDSGGGIGGLFGDLMPRDKQDDSEAAGEIILGGDDDKDDPTPRNTRPRPDPRDDRQKPSRDGKVDDDDIVSRGGFGRSK